MECETWKPTIKRRIKDSEKSFDDIVLIQTYRFLKNFYVVYFFEYLDSWKIVKLKAVVSLE